MRIYFYHIFKVILLSAEKSQKDFYHLHIFYLPILIPYLNWASHSFIEAQYTGTRSWRGTQAQNASRGIRVTYLYHLNTTTIWSRSHLQLVSQFQNNLYHSLFHIHAQICIRYFVSRAN